MYEMIEPILQFVAGLSGIAFSVAMAQLAKKIKSEYIKNTLERFADACGVAVREVYQVYIKSIKAAKDPNSAGGTKITKGEGQQALNMAKNLVMSYIGAKGLKILFKIFGADKFEKALEGRIEAALFDAKKKNPTKG